MFGLSAIISVFLYSKRELAVHVKEEGPADYVTQY